MLFSLSCKTLFATSQYRVSHVAETCLKLFPLVCGRFLFRLKKCNCSDLPTLVQSCTDLFLTRKQTTGKTKHVVVWLVTGK